MIRVGVRYAQREVRGAGDAEICDVLQHVQVRSIQSNGGNDRAVARVFRNTTVRKRGDASCGAIEQLLICNDSIGSTRQKCGGLVAASIHTIAIGTTTDYEQCKK